MISSLNYNFELLGFYYKKSSHKKLIYYYLVRSPELSSPEELCCATGAVLCIGLTYKPSAGPDLAELIEPTVEETEPRRSRVEEHFCSGPCKKNGDRLSALIQPDSAHCNLNTYIICKKNKLLYFYSPIRALVSTTSHGVNEENEKYSKKSYRKIFKN